ncbi:hypothetical protein DFH09DRAFT_1331410 [Mycena vulgaris]|nr:hypothetical protein DFH09DRAFT_1331410 [Mycena vulgaris]
MALGIVLLNVLPIISYLQTQLSAVQIGENFRGQPFSSAAVFAQCAHGIHQSTTKYGVFGIITAVVCFPCGLIALFCVSPHSHTPAPTN